MNKDVIYIEPEDDITDIITKIENSKEKIVALVPPKKAGVFRSIVNIKLIAKAGKNAEKTIVLVTIDPSIVKLAAVAKLPVTKNLQTAPIIPKLDEEATEEVVSKEELVEGPAEEVAEAEEVETLEAEAKEETKEDEEVTDSDSKNEKQNGEPDDDKSDDDKKPLKEGKNNKETDKDKKLAKKASKLAVIDWIKNHKKISIISGVGILLLILVLIWANVIAPAVTIDVVIRTTTANFSENVTFTEKLADEKASEGKFYIEQKKLESKSEVEFEATGKKNIGKKASGTVVAYTFFAVDGGSVAIDAGTAFTHGGLTYLASNSTSLAYDGQDATVCENATNANSLLRYGCQVSIRVPVVAAESGVDYNLAASSSGWHCSIATINAYSDSAMEGGTDETITVVQQSDIDAAKEKIESSKEDVNKAKLFDTVGEGHFIIESSFKQTVGEAVSTPAIGEQVEEGKKAKLSVTTTDTVFIIDETKMKEFIKEKAKLADGYEIYEMNDPFIENFTSVEGGYMGKLKTSYVSGPKVTEKDVVEVVKGKGIGTGRDDLTKEYNGISKVTTETSVPWVTSFPNDENKITVNISVEKQQ